MVDEHIALWEKMEGATRDALDKAFEERCTKQTLSEQNWEYEPEALGPIRDAIAACQGHDADKRTRAKEVLLTRTLASIQAWNNTLPCGAGKNIAAKFRVLDSQKRSWEEEWDAICKPVEQEALANATALAKAKERTSGGVTLTAEASFGSDVSAGTVGDAAAPILRDYYGTFSLQMAYRRFWPDAALDITFIPLRDSIGLDRGGIPSAYALSANLEVGRGSIQGSGVVIGLNAEVDRFARDTENRQYAFEERLAIPIFEKTFVQMHLRQTFAQGQGWDTEFGLFLAWSYEQNGEELARKISVLARR
jgi:hypothetical protein